MKNADLKAFLIININTIFLKHLYFDSDILYLLITVKI